MVWLVLGNGVGFVHSVVSVEGREIRHSSMEFYSITSAADIIQEVLSAGHISQEHATQFIRSVATAGTFPEQAATEDEECGISDFSILRLMEAGWNNHQIRHHLSNAGCDEGEIVRILSFMLRGLEDGTFSLDATNWKNSELSSADEDQETKWDQALSDVGAPMWSLALQELAEDA